MSREQPRAPESRSGQTAARVARQPDRPATRRRTHRTSRPAFGAALLAAAWLAVLPACAKREHRASAGASGPVGTLRVSQRNEPADLDPATASLPDEFFVIRALGEGLLLPAPEGGAPVPGLAAGYDVSPDGLDYTFHLRKNLRWSNGEPLTADDLVASYRRALEPATAAPKASLFFAVKNARAFATGVMEDFSAVGFRATDPDTLVVTLARPTATFPQYAASGPWIPVNPRVVAAFGRTWTSPGHQVGNGPFTLAEWRPQQRIVVRKNPLYRAADRVRVEQIQFLRFDNDDTEEHAFRSGQVDVTMSVPRSKLLPYANAALPGLHRRPLAETRFLSFNTHRAPLDDRRVRRALGTAIDRERLISAVLHGGQTPAERLIAPVLREDVAPLASEFRFDPAAARTLLADAGFPGGRGFPRLELVAWSPSQVPVLEAIVEMWRRELGISVGVGIHEAKVHLQALTSGNYDIGFVTTLLDVADAAAVLQDFTAGATNNFPGWQSVQYDEWLAAAARQADPDDRTEMMRRAETLLLESAPIAPLYFNVQNWLMAPRVHQWHQDALWNRSYDEITLDED